MKTKTLLTLLVVLVFLPAMCWGKTIRDQVSLDESGRHHYFLDAGDKLDLDLRLYQAHGGRVRMRTSRWGKFAIPDEETQVWGTRSKSARFWEVQETSQLNGNSAQIVMVFSHATYGKTIITIHIRGGCFRDWQISLPMSEWSRSLWLEEEKGHRWEKYTFPALWPSRSFRARLKLIWPDTTCRRLNRKHARMMR